MPLSRTIFEIIISLVAMSLTVEQLKERLAKVQAAIDAAVTGKRYKIQSGSSTRELERQSLAELERMESSLLAQISRVEGNGAVRHGVPCP